MDELIAAMEAARLRLVEAAGDGHDGYVNLMVGTTGPAFTAHVYRPGVARLGHVGVGPTLAEAEAKCLERVRDDGERGLIERAANQLGYTLAPLPTAAQVEAAA
jgi:hypothetical protein